MNSISLSESLPDRMRLRPVEINCFPLAIFEDLCKIIDTAIQGGDRRVHEGGILSVGFLILVRILNQVAPDFGIPINPLIQNWGSW